MSDTVIYCSKQVRALWPTKLPQQWAALYPQLFDADDVRITLKQPRNHFAEWFTAIHLFQRDGSLALVEKYVFGTHPLKVPIYRKVVGEHKAAFDEIRREVGGQPPDLLLYSSDFRLLGFAEVKGPGDRPHARQVRMHEIIRERLAVPVELVVVRLV